MSEKFQPLAIVGVSALFPGSSDAHGFWRDILAGRDLITDVPPGRWLIEDHYDPDPHAADKTYCKRGAFLSDVPFDPVEFGIPPNAMSATDTCQLLALRVAKQVLDDALKGQFREMDRERTSVILGVTSAQDLFWEVASRLQAPVWIKALRESGIAEDKVQEVRQRIAASYVPWQENTFPGLLGNVVAGRIANRFNLGGTNCVTDAACASSLSALSMAAWELQLGHSDLVIAGGADTFNDIPAFVCFSKTPALSPTGDCRPFSDRADGTLLGEGLAMFALRRLEDAARDGNNIYAVIRGIGSSSDGRSGSMYAPLAGGQAKALQRAYQAAGYGPETVELVEAHGTGTAAGDAAEIESLTAVFRASAERRGAWCALGSVKSQVGHTKAAAGAAGLFKAVMALHHKILPPTIKAERPHPNLTREQSPFYLNTRTRPWIRGESHPRRASVSSFGFGGTNFHATLEESNSGLRPALRWTAPSELVLLFARTRVELAGRCRELASTAPRRTLAETALKSQLSFDAEAAERLAIVADSNEDLIGKLQRFDRPAFAPGPGMYHSAGLERGRIAFLFPGQGSEYAGMTADLAKTFEDSRAVWDRASWLAPLVFPPPAFSTAGRDAQARRLAATECAQPVVAAAGAALLAVLSRLGIKPDCVGGYSFGEISALHAAGAISFDTMLRMARRPGELLAEAPAVPGAMLSVSLDATSLQQRIELWGLRVVIASHNGPRQSTLSGSVEAIGEAARRLYAGAIAAVPLPLSTAFHSPLVEGAVAPFRSFLEECEIAPCGVPVYSGFDGFAHARESSEWRDRLAQYLVQPVRFDALVNRMYEDGVRTLVDVGPGSVLGPLVRSILGERPHQVVVLDSPRMNGLTSLWHGLGQMAALGVPMNWSALRARHQVEVAPDAGDGRFVIHINGGNYGRPYPPPGGAAALPPPVPAQPRAAVPAAPPADSVQAYKIFQESISEAHRNWQENLAKGHESFLRAMESAYIGTAGQQPVSPAAVFRPAALPELISAPVPAAPVLPRNIYSPPPNPPSDFEVHAGSAPAPAVISSQVDFSQVVLSLISEKTGYPVDTLRVDMSLDADLGIDSIKRVEIFAALQEAVPSLPSFDTAAVGEIDTIAEVIALLDRPTPDSHKPEVLREIAAPPRRQVVVTVDVAPSGHITLDPSDGPVSITGDALVAPHLAELLRDRGYDVEVVDGIPADAAAVIVLTDLRGEQTCDGSTGANLQAFRAAQRVAARFSKEGGVFVLVRDPVNPWSGGLAGLARTAALEWPRARVKSIDIETAGRTPREIATALIKELVSGGPEVDIALSADGRRRHTVTTLVPGHSGNWEIGPESVLVVSGGARGVTARSVIELAHRTKARMLLLGLSEPVNAEVVETLRALADAGSPVRYARLEVRDRNALDGVLAEVRREWGPVTGLIHGAGVLADGRIENLSIEQFQSVFSTKVDGLRNLLDATRADPISVLCMFSSVAARCGNAGQSAYAVANEVMNRVAHTESARRLGQTKVKAIDWGPWQGGMVTPAMQRRWQGLGAMLIGLEDGAIAFSDELLEASESEVEVVLGDTPPAEPRELRVRIDYRSHPFLADHRIQDEPVLPVVEALELFLRCAMVQPKPVQPNEVLPLVCTNLKVLRGIRLDRFRDGGNILFVRPRQAGVFELCGPDGAVHYQATVGPETGAPAVSAMGDWLPQHATPWSETDIYGRLLFHGPAFRVIQNVKGISNSGIWGTVTGTLERQWQDGCRHSDGAMLDGGLQLARLWGFHSLGKPTLPLGIGRLHAIQDAADDGPVTCRVAGKVVGKSKIVCDVEFTASTGGIVGMMNGVEMYASPSE